MPIVSQLPTRLLAEPGRVVIRPFQIVPPAIPGQPRNLRRAQRIVDAVMAMTDEECRRELEVVNRDFAQRHWQTRRVFMERFEQVHSELDVAGAQELQKELIGAYFCHEYSYTSAALMNPSIVPHPDQSGLQEGALRVVMSLRAVGEGHISSIAFREGILRADGGFDLQPQPPFAVAARAVEMPTPENGRSTAATRFEEATLSGTVIFPFTDQQRNGLEDLRLVRLDESDDGGSVYVGTYTAYSGHNIASELLITRDFRNFRLQPIKGAAARNKGMALFPRKIGGKYAVIGRQDGENLFYLTSDDLLSWDDGEMLMAPKYPWELVQMGNCGSPIEIDEGWLLLTHGVGAMRKYCIGAALLDKDDPTKVIKRSVEPLLSPSDDDREGYVPNVVYTCGGLAHGGRLFLPYAVADSSVAFCWVDLPELLASMA